MVRITSLELPPIAVQYTGHVIQTETHDNDTALPFMEVLVSSYGLYRLYVIILSIIFI